MAEEDRFLDAGAGGCWRRSATSSRTGTDASSASSKLLVAWRPRSCMVAECGLLGGIEGDESDAHTTPGVADLRCVLAPRPRRTLQNWDSAPASFDFLFRSGRASGLGRSLAAARTDGTSYFSARSRRISWM